MKKILFLLNFQLIFFVSGHSQPLGFVQTECGFISNPNYTYENYSNGSHGFGYRVYHNGNIIAYGYNDLGPLVCEELKCIDDTTGFFVIWNPGYYITEVFKIINESVSSMGYAPSMNNEIFIASRHTVYITFYYISSSNHYPSKFFYIERLTDILPQKYLVKDTALVSDSIIYDTLIGIPFCSGLNELNYRVKTGSDTLIYTIRLKVDSLSYIPEQKKSEFNVFPNPARDFIYIKPSENIKHYSIKILNNLGISEKSFISNNSLESKIYIGDLENGVYFIVLENEHIKEVCKFIKS